MENKLSQQCHDNWRIKKNGSQRLPEELRKALPDEEKLKELLSGDR